MIKRALPCPFCHQPGRIYWDSHSVWQCTKCQLAFRQEAPTPNNLDNYYREGWQKESDNTIIVGGTDAGLAAIYTKRLLKQLEGADLKGQTILDFGAGKGTMMRALADCGAAVYGVDPYSFTYLQSQGLAAFPSLEQLPHGLHFNGIVTIQVIEHLSEPWSTLYAFREKLLNPGWVYLSTINVNSLNARLNGSRWREVKNPGHLFFYNSTSLEAILASSGYTNVQQIKDVIPYPNNNLLHRQLNRILQTVSLGGELTYLAWNR